MKTEQINKELLQALLDLQAMYADLISTHEPETDIFTDEGYVLAQNAIIKATECVE